MLKKLSSMLADGDARADKAPLEEVRIEQRYHAKKSSQDTFH